MNNNIDIHYIKSNLQIIIIMMMII